jgi:hypothetical protein
MVHQAQAAPMARVVLMVIMEQVVLVAKMEQAEQVE